LRTTVLDFGQCKTSQVFDCPFCGRDKHFYVYTTPEKISGWCFRCKTWASPNYCRGFLNAQSIQITHYEKKKSTKDERHRDELQVMQTMPLASGSALTVEYMEVRGIPKATLDHIDARVCNVGSLRGRVILPIRKNGVWKAFVGRSLLGQEPKYLSSRAKIIMPLPECMSYEYLVVVEGYFDALKVALAGFNVVCTFGGDISQDVWRQLCELRVGELLVLPDPDHQLTSSVLRRAWPFPVRCAEPLPGTDPGDAPIEVLEAVLAGVYDLQQGQTFAV